MEVCKAFAKSVHHSSCAFLGETVNENIFWRSEKSDLAMARTDQFLENCFSQYEVIQTDVIVI
jgi:hypothetical protein